MAFEKERKNIVAFYILFAAGIVMDFIPFMGIEILGLCIATVTIVAAYIYRARASLDSLTYNHMSFLITTFWVSSLILLIGMAIATFWVFKLGDHAAILTIIEGMNNGVIFTENDLRAIFGGYVGTNMKLLLIAAGTTLGPGLLYIVYRLWKGGRLAVKGDRVQSPSAWF
jgi:uncharacterized membrane protein